MKSRLEDQTAEVVALTTKINELQAQIIVERQEKEKLQMFVKSGSLPDDTKMGAFTSMPMAPLPTVSGEYLLSALKGTCESSDSAVSFLEAQNTCKL